MYPLNEQKITTFGIHRSGDNKQTRFFAFDNGERTLIVNRHCQSYGSWMTQGNFVKAYKKDGEELNLDNLTPTLTPEQE